MRSKREQETSARQRAEREAAREAAGDHRPRCTHCEHLLFRLRHKQWMWCALCQTVAHGWTTDRELYEMGIDPGEIVPLGDEA